MFPSPGADLPEENERRSFCCGMTVSDLGIFDNSVASIEPLLLPPADGPPPSPPDDLFNDSAQLHILLSELNSAPADSAWLDFIIDSIGHDPDSVAVTFGVI